ncbi:MAG: hypothetical protein ABIX00_10765, partial [Polaromonas sp.]
MTRFALQTKNFSYAKFRHCGKALLRRRVTAVSQLLTAMRSDGKPDRQGVSRIPCARQEADQVRAMADDVLRTDASFAQEL